MCQKCVDLVEKYYPSLPREQYGELLVGATCYPLGTPEEVEQNLIEALENTDGSLEGALWYSDYLITEFERKYENKIRDY